MIERIKWVLAAFGIMFGSQLIASMLLTGFALWGGNAGDVSAAVAFTISLAAFLLGGLIVGNAGRAWRIPEIFIATVVTLAVAAMIYDSATAVTVNGFAAGGLLVDPAGYGTSREVFISLATLAALVGAFIGYERASKTGNGHEAFTLFLGLGCGSAAPLLLLGGALGWESHWLIVFASAVVAVVGFVYWRLTRKTGAAGGVYAFGRALIE